MPPRIRWVLSSGVVALLALLVLARLRDAPQERPAGAGIAPRAKKPALPPSKRSGPKTSNKKADPKERALREQALRTACDELKRRIVSGDLPDTFKDAWVRAFESEPALGVAVLRQAGFPGQDRNLWQQMLPLLARFPSWDVLEFISEQTAVRAQTAEDGQHVRIAVEMAEQVAAQAPLTRPHPALKEFHRWMTAHPEEGLRSRAWAATLCFVPESERRVALEELFGMVERDSSTLILVGIGLAFQSADLSGQDWIADRAARVLGTAEDPWRRRAALEALAATRTPAVEAALRQILQDPQDPLFAQALFNVGRLESESLLPVVEAAVSLAVTQADEGITSIRNSGLAALTMHDSAAAGQALLRLLQLPLLPNEREKALSCLTSSPHMEGDVSAAARLIDLAQNRDWGASSNELLQALASNGTAPAADFLSSRYALAATPVERYEIGRLLLRLPPEHSFPFIRREFRAMEAAPYFEDVVDRLIRELDQQGGSLRSLYGPTTAASLSVTARGKIIERLGELGNGAAKTYLAEIGAFETDPALKAQATEVLRGRMDPSTNP